ncbi:MAG: RagB/SusD family nutrient uptake outer membrane protein [Odoribacter sp.]
MKNKFYILIVGVLLGEMTISCDSFFDMELKNSIKEDDFYKNSNDLNAAAFGIYATIAPEVHKFLLWGSARADMVTNGSESDAFVTEFVNNTVSSQNPYTNYAFLYQAIARCNQQLESLYKVQPSVNASRKYLDCFYGESYFMRAFCYFWLVRTYKDFPLLEEDISETVKYVSSSGDTIRAHTLSLSNEDIRSLALQPASEQKVWGLIQSDLNRALQLLRSDPQWLIEGYGGWPELSKIRGSLKSAGALAAEVAVWMGKYAEAVAYASSVTGAESLGNADAWASQFTGTITNGSAYTLFSFAYAYTYGRETNRLQEFTSNVEQDGGRYLLKPVMSVYNEIFNESEDCRRISAVRIDRKPLIWKYIGQDAKGESMRKPYESSASFHSVKTADVFLWQAIAANRFGNYDMAFSILNNLRVARGLTGYTKEEIKMTTPVLEALLFKEKAREDAYEGKRWYDLLLMETRLGYTGIIGTTISKKYTDAAQAAEVKNRLSAPASWYLPIDPDKWK